MVRWCIVLVAVVAAAAGCSDEGESLPEDVEATSASPPVQRWTANARAARAEYLRKADALAPGLGQPVLLTMGVDVCRAMFDLASDGELVEIVQQRSVKHTDVRLDSDQAVRLIVVAKKGGWREVLGGAARERGARRDSGGGVREPVGGEGG